MGIRVKAGCSVLGKLEVVMNNKNDQKSSNDQYLLEFQEYVKTEKSMAWMTQRRIKKFGGKALLNDDSYGEWKTISYDEFGELVKIAGKAFIELGFEELEKIGIFSMNRSEWHISDMGALTARLVDVSIYGTDSAKEAEYIINDAELKLVFAGNQEQYDKIMEVIDDSQYLKYVVVFDKNAEIDTNDKRVMSWDDFLEIGRKSKADGILEERLSKTNCDDVATMIYTSGTTGDPKGAVITHLNLLHEQWSVGNYVLPDANEKDVSLCFLPLSHIYERSYCYGIIMKGAQIYYCSDPSMIVEYLADVRPTIMNSVPRLYEKIYSTVYAKLETVPKFKQNLFHWAVAVGKEASPFRQKGEKLPVGISVRYFLAKKLVLDKVRGAFSDKSPVLSAGGAALSAEIAEFFYNAGISLYTGYGLTETAPVVTANTPARLKFGTNGPVIPLVEVRIDEETGEIQTRGPNVFKEYYKKPEATKAAFTDDGWFKTGDIGYFDDEGFLYITDRIKDLIITSGGKNIAPQKIETSMAEEYYIEYAVVIGEGRKYISALIVPSFEALEEFAKKNKIEYSGRKELVEDSRVLSLYQDIIDRRCSDYGQVEKIKKFRILMDEFSQETGEITPTMKLKRKVISEKYRSIIEEMYRD